MDMLLTVFDWESFSESGSSEDQEDIDSMYGGKAQSILSTLEETIGKIDDFLKTDGESGACGYACGLGKCLWKSHKRHEFKETFKDRSISIEDYVVLGPWLGRVNEVVDSVTILFDDRAKCEVTGTDDEKISPMSPDMLEDPQYQYYPAQSAGFDR